MALKTNAQTFFNSPHYQDENSPFLCPYICYSKAVLQVHLLGAAGFTYFLEPW